MPLQYYGTLSVGDEGRRGMYLLRTISALHFPAPRTADIRDWGELIRLRALNADVYREHSALWAPASVFSACSYKKNHCDMTHEAHGARGYDAIICAPSPLELAL